jgi:N-acetylmuramoyl-L-alanine amidase
MTSCSLFRSSCLAGLFLALGVILGAAPARAGNGEIVTAARLGVHGTETRFVLELTGKAPYTVAFQTGPDRIIIELPKLRWQHAKTAARATSGLISRYAFDPLDGSRSRLVLELRSPAKVKAASYIPPESGHDWRLVLDLEPAAKRDFEHLAAAAPPAEAKPEPKPEVRAEAKPQQKPEIKAEAKPEVREQAKPESKAAPPANPAPAPAAAAGAAKPLPGPAAPPSAGKPETRLAVAAPTAVQPPAPPVAPLAPSAAPPAAPKPEVTALPKPHLPDAVSRPVIVIDPGHGGDDPGAQAADGTMEKDLVLNVARALAKKLEKSGRYSVVLTRSADATLKLHERVDISRAAHGALFVSVHANLFEKSDAVNGLSIYTLSDRASSKAAAELARMENRADLLAGIDLSHENDDVTHILLDLAQHETLDRSVQFAHRLADAVSRTTPLEKNYEQQASLVVLKAPDVPSVLVELGYLTNEADLARMKSDSWIDQFADAFLAAADRQFQIKNASDERAVLR